MSKILMLSCHTDDTEIGCGATIHRLIEKGYEVYSVVFVTKYPQFPDGKLLDEWHQSMSVLKVSMNNRFLFDYPVRRLDRHRQEILEDMVSFRKYPDPDYIFTPSIKSIHQDHSVIGIEALRAFRDKILWNYELPWSDMGFQPQIYVPISDIDLEFKISALRKYESQFELKRSYFSEKLIRGLAAMRGAESGVELAEAFVVQRMVWSF